MEWLKNDIKEDPILPIRWNKYIAGPQRKVFKNKTQLNRYQRIRDLFIFYVGSRLAHNVACRAGGLYQLSANGVPAVPQPIIAHESPNTAPVATAWKRFRVGYWSARLVGGYALYRICRDKTGLRDEYYTRPDFKPKAAMVVSHSSYDDIAAAQI